METITNLILDNKASILLAIPLVTRTIKALVNGGGIMGAWNALIWGKHIDKPTTL